MKFSKSRLRAYLYSTLLTDQQCAHSDGHHSVFSKLGASQTDVLRTVSECAINYGKRVHAKALKISSNATSVTINIGGCEKHDLFIYSNLWTRLVGNQQLHKAKLN
jgi:hypothetical protein